MRAQRHRSKELWDKVHSILTESPAAGQGRSRRQTPALLKGLIFGPKKAANVREPTRKGGRLYCYYVSQTVLKQGRGAFARSGACLPPYPRVL